MKLTTTELNEYRSIDSTIQFKKELVKKSRAEAEFLLREAEGIEDDIAQLRRRKRELRRRGAY